MTGNGTVVTGERLRVLLAILDSRPGNTGRRAAVEPRPPAVAVRGR